MRKLILASVLAFATTAAVTSPSQAQFLFSPFGGYYGGFGGFPFPYRYSDDYYGDPYYRPGYNAWRRGALLPPSYRGYVINDYYRYRLRPPPRGYVWYRVGDSFMLTGVANGVIFEVVPFD